MAKFKVVGVTPEGAAIFGKAPGCRHWMHALIFFGLCLVAGPVAPFYPIVWAICWLESKRG